MHSDSPHPTYAERIETDEEADDSIDSLLGEPSMTSTSFNEEDEEFSEDEGLMMTPSKQTAHTES